MKIIELEQLIRDGMRAHPGQHPLALVTGDGPLATQIPARFGEAANTLAARPKEARKGDEGQFNGWA